MHQGRQHLAAWVRRRFSAHLEPHASGPGIACHVSVREQASALLVRELGF
jgi:hypothetical protein